MKFLYSDQGGSSLFVLSDNIKLYRPFVVTAGGQLDVTQSDILFSSLSMGFCLIFLF